MTLYSAQARKFWLACMAGIAFAALATPARADAPLTRWPATLISAPGAPAKLDYCEGNSDGFAAFFGADFENNGTTALKSVRLRFDFYDAFGALLHSESGDAAGIFSRGVRVSRAGNNGWMVGSRWFDGLTNVASIRCAIEKTLDANGTVWQNRTLPSPAPSPT